MQIATGFSLAMPVDEAWPLLTNLERVAPSMPGVKVESVDDNGLHATMRVKVGPITASYRTLVTIESLDEAARTAILKASGREARGPGTVEARVQAVLSEREGATAVDLTTDLAVTGRVAQFGGGVMTEVADRLLQQFADSLERDLSRAEAEENGAAAVPERSAPGASAPTESAPAGSVAASTAESSAPDAIDLGALAGDALRPRIVRLAAALVAAIVLLAILHRSRR